MKYKVLHTRAGEHPKGAVIDESEIVDVDFWLRAKAIEPVEALEPKPSEDEIQARLLAEDPIPAKDLHHMTAKSLGLVKSEDGEFWIKPAS